MPANAPHGVLLIDKPAGITSFDVIRKMRRMLQTKKIGHAGTLDPFATGLLVLCVGHYTRFAGYLTEDDKAYVATVELGVETATHDTEGEVVQRAKIPNDWDKELEQILPRFRGEISQVPPAYSAIHIDGKRAYDLARKGEKVEIPARTITVHELRASLFKESAFDLTVRASKGTYIRALGRDIGRALGCGAHLTALRRHQSGRFSIDDAHTLDKLEQYTAEERLAALRQNEDALPMFARLELQADDVKKLQDGKKVDAKNADDGCYAAYHADDATLLGLVDVVPNTEEGEVLHVEEQPERILKVRRLLPTS